MTALASSKDQPRRGSNGPEWVEIIEPRTQEHMFANLTTGECLWDPPEGVPVKKTNSNQWWELFDQNTARFYYYNAVSQKTVWHRPNDCDIIPLAKLQTLKQNTEVSDETNKELKKKKGSEQPTQTAEVLLDRIPNDPTRKVQLLASSSMQTSPVSSPRALRRSLRSMRHHQRRTLESDVNSPSSDEYKSFAVKTKSTRRSSNDVYTVPHQQQRLFHPEQPNSSPGDSRRTTIGPSQAKYYSIPHRSVGEQSSNHSRQPQPLIYSMPSGKPRFVAEENGHKRESPSSFASSISRSVSFMSRQPTRGSEDQPAYTSSSSGKFEINGGRRSVESTPQSTRRVRDSPESNHSGSFYANSPRGSDIGSPIDGYCTPMINRRPRLAESKLGESQSSPLKEQPQLSISNLVDSGLSALTDGDEFKKPNPPSRISNGSHQRPHPQHYNMKRNNGTNSMSRSKMSPLQQYILEQAKLSGYRFGDPLDVDRDSYVESEDDLTERLDDSDDFADDEDGGVSDTISKASSVDGEDGRFLSEPTYNNLDPMWMQSVNNYQSNNYHVNRPVQQQPRQSAQDIDAFSEEFDIRMRFSHRGTNNHQGSSSSSTIPRPSSHQPTSSSNSVQQQQQQQQMQNPAYPVPYDVLHPSLQRNTYSLIDPTTSSSSTLRGTKSNNMNNNNNNTGIRHQSNRKPNNEHGGSMLSVSASIHSTISCESDIEKYAQDNLNIQKKGLFRKKMTVKDILTHTKESISKPLTCLSNKAAKKEAIEVFRLLQIYMGDRRAKPNMTINSVALDITGKGFGLPPLRDEIFVQLCKQTTENMNSRESLRRGWELMAICLSFFPPSVLFTPALQSYIQKHRDSGTSYPDVGKWPIHIQISHYAGICAKRLDRIGDGGRLNPKKPTIEDIDQSRLQIFRPSMFGGTLQETMDMQRERFPQRRLPWIFTTLAEQIMQLHGPTTEGIFRVPADLDEVNVMKSRFDQWEVPVCVDCHTAASLLKLWMRELYEPIIPDHLYDMCVQIGESPFTPNDSFRLMEVMDRLPVANRDLVMFFMRYLQFFARPEISNVTKMDASNLGTVFAPNFLRCPSKDPMVIMENTRKEMAFLKNMIVSLDTSCMEGVL